MLLPSVMSLHQKRQQRRHLRYPLQKVLVHSQRWFAFVCLLCCCAYVVVYVLLLLVFFIGMPMGQAVVQDSIYIYNKQTTMQLTAGDVCSSSNSLLLPILFLCRLFPDCNRVVMAVSLWRILCATLVPFLAMKSDDLIRPRRLLDQTWIRQKDTRVECLGRGQKHSPLQVS
eukprot:m.196751 g.196751  ORF g.196751 m.196751 type:complete len:171 (-) comp13678_c2_seq21:27-539(-)